TLAEALDSLSHRFALPIEINAKAFKDGGIEEVEKQLIAEGRPIPVMTNVPLARVLRTVLARVPAQSAAVFVVRDDHVEVTTDAASRAELGRTDGDDANPKQLLPLVRITLDKVPLEEALKQMARKTRFNVLIDARVAEQAKVPVTASLTNVPLDTAVRLL